MNTSFHAPRVHVPWWVVIGGFGLVIGGGFLARTLADARVQEIDVVGNVRIGEQLAVDGDVDVGGSLRLNNELRFSGSDFRLGADNDNLVLRDVNDNNVVSFDMTETVSRRYYTILHLHSTIPKESQYRG